MQLQVLAAVLLILSMMGSRADAGYIAIPLLTLAWVYLNVLTMLHVINAERWCVARPGLSEATLDNIVLEEFCNEGAAASEDVMHDCGPIVQDTGACFQPNTRYQHASYVINASWNRRVSRGQNLACDFTGLAMLVTQDPSTCNVFSST
ncbi:hypothetical protein L7F22_010614 [Adiantum nelumboides]|nr:hypothetical protein [Adiantum nelumboides]